jgi:hypothetical protein
MIQHAHMRGASVEDKKRAMQEFKNFWYTQVTQAEDNEVFGKQIQSGKVWKSHDLFCTHAYSWFRHS